MTKFNAKSQAQPLPVIERDDNDIAVADEDGRVIRMTASPPIIVPMNKDENRSL